MGSIVSMRRSLPDVRKICQVSFGTRKWALFLFDPRKSCVAEAFWDFTVTEGSRRGDVSESAERQNAALKEMRPRFSENPLPPLVLVVPVTLASVPPLPSR